jgi:cytoskeleton protein RodZ
MTDVPASPGPRLKAERERRALSPQKAADELHLDAWVVDALESEDYERVGPPVYAKGHLKRYAELLGLPAADIMAGYVARVQVPKPPPVQSGSVRMRAEVAAVSGLPWAQVAGLAAAVFLLIGLFWWKPWHRHAAAAPSGLPVAENTLRSAANAGSDFSPAADGTAAPAPAQAQTQIQAQLQSQLQAPKPAQQQVPAAAEADPTAGSGRARLRLSFSADSWVDIHDAAGRREFAGKGRANSVKTVAGIAPMRVYLGSASGVQLEINSRAVAIGPQFVAGNVARFEAGADGVLRRDSHSQAAAVASPAPGVPAGAAPVQSRNARPTG